MYQCLLIILAVVCLAGNVFMSDNTLYLCFTILLCSAGIIEAIERTKS